MFEDERFQCERQVAGEAQLLPADDSSAQAFQRGEVQRVDDLVHRLRLEQLGETAALLVHLVQMAAALQHHLDGTRRTRLALRQYVQGSIAVLTNEL